MHRTLSVVAAALLLAACSSETTDPPRDGAGISIPIDDGLAPAEAQRGDRAIARMVGESGVAMDFVLGELVVHAADASKVDTLAQRWGGRVLETSDGNAGAPKTYRVAIDPNTANVDQLLGDLHAKVPDARGTFRTSNEAAAKLIAVALSETNAGGVTVSLNFIGTPADLLSGSTTEGPSGPPGYTSDAAQWSYMNRGSAQDIGVVAAWQAMARAGAINNKIPITVIDGGFSPTAEFPVERSVIGDWNVANIGKCGESDCPWHGTSVVDAAMGRADNGIGGAGPAGPVARAIAVPFQLEFFALISTIERIAVGSAAGRIINMSWSFELDLGWDILVKALCLGQCPSPSEMAGAITSTVANSGRLLFAAAGNKGVDVDNGGANPEGSTIIPCELPGVHCIGGMNDDSVDRAANSNWGSRAGEGSVDMYGPFCVWTGPTPDAPGPEAKRTCGTSVASPFVAGVAALTWAANPSRSAREVWDILRETAHVGGIDPAAGNRQRVNAFGAVTRALSPGLPSVVLNGAPTATLNREWMVTAAVTDEGAPCGACTVVWDPPPTRATGNTAYYRFDEAGPKTIRASVFDVAEQSASAQTTVTVDNSAPTVRVLAPSTGANVQQGVPTQLLASALDLNEGPDPGPGPVQCVWTSSNPADSVPAQCSQQVTFGSQGTRTLTVTATDPQGLSATANVVVTVTAPPDNFPPNISVAALPAPVYNGNGFPDTYSFTLDASATTDPENDTPITYQWSASSFRPNSAVVYKTITPIGTGAVLTWKPEDTAGLIGRFAELNNACYDGQLVQLQVSATDSLGNTSVHVLPDLRVYGCVLE